MGNEKSNLNKPKEEEKKLVVTHGDGAFTDDTQSCIETNPYEIVPKKQKFNKIDLVRYGKVFDEYGAIRSAMPDMERTIQQYGDKKWYLSSQNRTRLMQTFKPFQFPLNELLTFCVSYNQTELLEYVCTQELIEYGHWERAFFLANIFEIITSASHLMKLSSLNVIASYMIPERINDKDFKSVIQKAYRFGSSMAEQKRYQTFCMDMVEEGMNGRAQRIIQTRKALVDFIQIDFPNELIGVVVGFAFGMCHRSKA
eukprot:79644_1